MNKVVSIEKNLPHTVAELMCLRCFYRWIGAFPSELLLKDIVCPCCNRKGRVINTGQEMDEGIDDVGIG